MSFCLPSQLLIADRSENDPVALRDGYVYRWGQFLRTVAGLAHCFRHQVFCRYALATDDAWYFVTGLFALWLSGKHIVLPNNFLPGTLKAIANDAEVILNDHDLAVLVQSQSQNLNEHCCDLPKFGFQAEDCLIDLYTSGSTGHPKCIRKTLRQLEVEVAALEALWGDRLNTASTVVATVPCHHIYGLLFRILWPLSKGCVFDTKLYVVPEFLLHQIKEQQQVCLISSPAQLSRFSEAINLEALKTRLTGCFSSGGPLSWTVVEQFQRGTGCCPTEVLGSTETGGMAWREQQAEDPAWTFFQNVSGECDHYGALMIRSPYLPIEVEFWKTEDCVEMAGDRRFLLKGRLDRIVKLEEKRLSLDDLERRLKIHDWINESALMILEGRRSLLCAAVVLTEEGKMNLEKLGKPRWIRVLRLYLSSWYDAVLLPRRWRFVEVLPLNERGKVCRNALLQLFE